MSGLRAAVQTHRTGSAVVCWQADGRAGSDLDANKDVHLTSAPCFCAEHAFGLALISALAGTQEHGQRWHLGRLAASSCDQVLIGDATANGGQDHAVEPVKGLALHVAKRAWHMW